MIRKKAVSSILNHYDSTGKEVLLISPLGDYRVVVVIFPALQDLLNARTECFAPHTIPLGPVVAYIYPTPSLASNLRTDQYAPVHSLVESPLRALYKPLEEFLYLTEGGERIVDAARELISQDIVDRMAPVVHNNIAANMYTSGTWSTDPAPDYRVVKEVSPLPRVIPSGEHYYSKLYEAQVPLLRDALLAQGVVSPRE